MASTVQYIYSIYYNNSTVKQYILYQKSEVVLQRTDGVKLNQFCTVLRKKDVIFLQPGFNLMTLFTRRSYSNYY